jgi:hypothetical protein
MSEKDDRQKESAASGPMAMGMGMAKKMMAQRETSEGKPPMEKMMSMCAGVLNAIRETNALAVYGTPDLRASFSEWLGTVEEKALAAIKDGDKDAVALASVLGTSEEGARYVLMQLAAKGKITLTARING